MGRRRKARETAMQFLYQTEVTRSPEESPSKEFWQEASPDADVKTFAVALFGEAIAHRPEIDGLIEKYALHWKINRIAAVDLAILRVAIAEMLFIPSTPPVVVIDEAVEIAKKFSTQESGAFVNGILDKVKNDLVDGKRKD